MGFIFQQFHLLPRKSVMENVLLSEVYPVEVEHSDEEVAERARRLLTRLGLADKLEVPPNKLSRRWSAAEGGDRACAFAKSASTFRG